MVLTILDENIKERNNAIWIKMDNIYNFNIKPVSNLTNKCIIKNENNVQVEAYCYNFLGRLVKKDEGINNKTKIMGYFVIENNEIKVISNISNLYYNGKIRIIKSNNIYYYLTLPEQVTKNEINNIFYNIDMNIRCFISANKQNLKLYIINKCEKNIVKEIIENSMEIDDY